MKSNYNLIFLGVLAFLLSGMPKVRWVIGAPIYLVDLVILVLLLGTSGKKSVRYVGRAGTLVSVVGVYWFFLVIGELRGLLVYQQVLESVYMLFRFCLACSLVWVIPKIIQSTRELLVVVKGLCAGLTLSALLSVMYSVPFTRGFTNALFSISLINPVDQNAAMESAETLRGNTLIGTSTFSSGLMAMLWPLLFMGGPLLSRVKSKPWWKSWMMGALVLVPLGILATYGRSAWLGVLLVLVSMLLWGSAKGRLQSVFWGVATVLIVVQVGIDSELMMVDRIIAKTQKTIEDPLEGDSETERFMAYVEPFQHVVKYPSFLLAGSGAAQRKWGGNAFEEAGTASHAIPGMAYYAYGMGGAICQVLIMVTSFGLAYQRMNRARREFPSMVWMWRAVLAAWFGLLPWFLFAHGIVTQPRGAMAYFLYFGTVLACEQIYVREVAMTRFWLQKKGGRKLDNHRLRAVQS